MHHSLVSSMVQKDLQSSDSECSMCIFLKLNQNCTPREIFILQFGILLKQLFIISHFVPKWYILLIFFQKNPNSADRKSKRFVYMQRACHTFNHHKQSFNHKYSWTGVHFFLKKICLIDFQKFIQ